MKKIILVGVVILFTLAMFAMACEDMNIEELSAPILGKRNRDEELFAQEKKQKFPLQQESTEELAADPMPIEQPVQTTANSFIKLINDADPREVEIVRPIPFSSCLLCMYQGSFICCDPTEFGL